MYNKVKETRIVIGLSASELARRAKISRQTVVNIEANLVQPSGATMLVISEVLKKDPRDIFFTSSVNQVLQEVKHESVQ
jgi:DNA-binding XRE family transcriptional regulator